MSDAPTIDYARVLADLKAGDPETIRRAYRDTFGGQIGRFVLVHFLHDCGVGVSRGRQVGAEERAYQDGLHDAALRLLELAEHSQQAAAIVAVADTLEGQPDATSPSPDARYGDELDFE